MLNLVIFVIISGMFGKTREREKVQSNVKCFDNKIYKKNNTKNAYG